MKTKVFYNTFIIFIVQAFLNISFLSWKCNRSHHSNILKKNIYNTIHFYSIVLYRWLYMRLCASRKKGAFIILLVKTLHISVFSRVRSYLALTLCWPSGFLLTSEVGWEHSFMQVTNLLALTCYFIVVCVQIFYY